jgi:hypothetical protein
VSIKGTGAKPSDEDFPKVIDRITVFREFEGGLSAQDAVRRFRCEKPDGYRDHILILQDLHDEFVWHVVTWWRAEYDPEIGKAEFYFIINVDEVFEDTTNKVLYVREERIVSVPGQFSFSLPLGCGAPAPVRPITPSVVPVTLEATEVEIVPSVAEFQKRVQRAHAQPPGGLDPSDFGLPPDATSPFGLTDEEAAELAGEDYITQQCKGHPWPVLLLPHPEGSVSKDVVRDDACPFDDRLVAIFPGQIYVKTKAHRYAVSYNIVRAMQWGWLLFGTRAFVVLEGPLTPNPNTGERDIAYYTIPLDHAIEFRELKAQSAKARAQVGGRDLFGVVVKHWIVEFLGPDRRSSILRVLGTANQFNLLMPSFSWTFYCELEREVMGLQAAGEPGTLEIPTDRAKREAFSRVERERKAKKDQNAADELTYLSRVAFALLDTTDPNGGPSRLDYIILLIDAWTLDAHERAIVEIIRSEPSFDGFQSLVKALKDKDKFQKLVDDLDNRLWDLLQTIGTRFGDRVTVEMNVQFFLNLFLEVGVAAGAPGFMGALGKLEVKLDGANISVSIQSTALAEMQEAGQALLRFLVSNLEGVWMLLSQPDKVIEGVWQLIKLVVMIELAHPKYNYPPAQQFVDALARSIAKQLLATYKGMLILDAGDKVVRRVRWMLVMEIASMLIGVGEIRAALEAASSVLRLGDRIAGLARLARVFKTVGKVEAVTMRMERIAVLMANEGRLFTRSEEAMRLLSALPSEDLTLLERALAKANLEDVPNVSALTKASPDVAKAMERIEPRLELLQTIERKMVC